LSLSRPLRSPPSTWKEPCLSCNDIRCFQRAISESRLAFISKLRTGGIEYNSTLLRCQRREVAMPMPLLAHG
jgi:hypothetical protein